MKKKRLKNNFPAYLKVKGLMKKELFLIRNNLKACGQTVSPEITLSLHLMTSELQGHLLY